MLTLRQCFETDLRHALSIHPNDGVELRGNNQNVRLFYRLYLDFDSGTKFIVWYIPTAKDTFEICRWLVQNPTTQIDVDKRVLTQGTYEGEFGSPTNADLKFAGRMFLYTETGLTEEQISQLIELAEASKLVVTIRGPQYLFARQKNEKPLAFLSHDSRDKEGIAQPLAIEMMKLLCPVWYDEHSLRVGDSLRESIEKGLKECKKCILLLSKNFLTNNGWTKREFNSVFTKELIEQQNVILPVWCDVTLQEVYEYSPSLADRLAVKWEEGKEKVAGKLVSRIINP